MIKVGEPQWLFMAETEGLDDIIDTREVRINAVIKDIKKYPAPSISEKTFRSILKQHSIVDITNDELSCIISAIDN